MDMNNTSNKIYVISTENNFVDKRILKFTLWPMLVKALSSGVMDNQSPITETHC